MYPKYQSHRVEAFKIREIEYDADKAHVLKRETDGSAILHPEDKTLHAKVVDREYIQSQKPKEGGYWVKFENGSEHWLSENFFEEAYLKN